MTLVRQSFVFVGVCVFLGMRCTPTAFADAGQEAGQAVERFYQAFYQQHWSDAAAEMHPEALSTLHRMLVHIAETTSDLKERQQFLREFGGVETIAAFKTIDPKVAFVRMYNAALKQSTAEYQSMWRQSRLKVLGAVQEGDVYHVVLRTYSQIAGFAGSVVTVASVKRDQGKWKVYTSMEFERVIEKLKQ